MADLNTETIGRFLNRPRARGGAITIGAKRSEGGALRVLAERGIAIGAVPRDALRGFKLPQAVDDEDDAPTSLSDADIERLLRALAADLSYAGVRLALWCHLMLDTGMRPAEFPGLSMRAVDRVGRSIRLLGKGAKHRTVYFGEQTEAVLARYLRFRGDAPYPELFAGRSGPMTAGSFGHEFAALAARIGLAACADAPPPPVPRSTSSGARSPGASLSRVGPSRSSVASTAVRRTSLCPAWAGRSAPGRAPSSPGWRLAR